MGFYEYQTILSVVMGLLILAAFGGRPYMAHRQKMKQLEIERIREQRLLVEAQSHSAIGLQK